MLSTVERLRKQASSTQRRVGSRAKMMEEVRVRPSSGMWTEAVLS